MSKLAHSWDLSKICIHMNYLNMWFICIAEIAFKNGNWLMIDECEWVKGLASESEKEMMHIHDMKMILSIVLFKTTRAKFWLLMNCDSVLWSVAMDEMAIPNCIPFLYGVDVIVLYVCMRAIHCHSIVCNCVRCQPDQLIRIHSSFVRWVVGGSWVCSLAGKWWIRDYLALCIIRFRTQMICHWLTA